MFPRYPISFPRKSMSTTTQAFGVVVEVVVLGVVDVVVELVVELVVDVIVVDFAFAGSSMESPIS
jgi:hypothetical protein